jgi:hypothetical protein
MAGWRVTLTGTHCNAPATSFDLLKQLLRTRHLGIRTENFTLPLEAAFRLLRSSVNRVVSKSKALAGRLKVRIWFWSRNC